MGARLWGWPLGSSWQARGACKVGGAEKAARTAQGPAPAPQALGKKRPRLLGILEVFLF